MKIYYPFQDNFTNSSCDFLELALNYNPILTNQEYLYKSLETDNVSSLMSPSTSGIENLTACEEYEIEGEDYMENTNLTSALHAEISKRMDTRLNSVNLFYFIQTIFFPLYNRLNILVVI